MMPDDVWALCLTEIAGDRREEGSNSLSLPHTNDSLSIQQGTQKLAAL